jgi:hypothetical protein
VVGNFSNAARLPTGIHFHYAGFLLPVLAGLLGGVFKHWSIRVAEWGVIFGVPFCCLGNHPLGIWNDFDGMVGGLVYAPDGYPGRGVSPLPCYSVIHMDRSRSFRNLRHCLPLGFLFHRLIGFRLSLPIQVFV